MKNTIAFGRVVALPLMLVIFGINFLGYVSHIGNFSQNSFNGELNIILLIGFVSIFLTLTYKYYGKAKKIFLTLFVLSVFLYQNLFINFLHYFLIRTPDFDPLNDMSFVIIIPASIIAIQLWGWCFDLVKNKSQKII